MNILFLQNFKLVTHFFGDVAATNEQIFENSEAAYNI